MVAGEAMSRGLLRGSRSRMIRSQASTSVRTTSGKALELALQPVLDRRPPIIVQQADLLEAPQQSSPALTSKLLRLDDLGVPDGAAGSLRIAG